MTARETGINPDHAQWMRYWLPYHFQPMDIPGKKHVYLPLNREYKPIGIIPYSPKVKYEDYLANAVQFARDPHTFKGIWTPDPNGNLFLYSDGYLRQQDYFRRLDRLCQHKMKLLGAMK